MKEISTNPESASNQVWRQNDGEDRVVEGVSVSTVYFEDRLGTAWLGDMRHLPEWRCIGISTPAGRVMVGERRHAPDGRAVTVTHVMGGGYVGLSVFDAEVGANAIESVVLWPLLPPATAPQGNTADQPRASGCVCQWEHGDRACPVHPTCKACGCVVCECKPKPALPPGWEPMPPAPLAWAPKPDPRAEREQRRREIDAELREDARRFPAFATARRAAVLAAYESAPPMPPEDMLPVGHTKNILRDCHRYEAKRGGMTKPSADAVKWAALAGGTYEMALAVYERARSLP